MTWRSRARAALECRDLPAYGGIIGEQLLALRVLLVQARHGGLAPDEVCFVTEDQVAARWSVSAWFMSE